ncbi:hypothetical protein RJT34_08943 [Clitoria ternatea]|uniref:F-box domain-containing protein n=1 Tax=Clitoria ternatea TaxID=43366 RepID=A0AAN9PW25_CLITE
MDYVECPLPVLPEELVLEILSWVPVKHLMRMRCVSKSWNSLIFSPTLVNLHLQRSSSLNTHLLLTVQKLCSTRAVSCSTRAVSCSIDRVRQYPSFPPASPIYDEACAVNFPSGDRDSVHVVGVCNGLACLYGHSPAHGHWVQFWNPATRLRSQKSPILEGHRLAKHAYAKFGFGYDHSTDIYKVVAMILDERKERRVREMRVHCMGYNCWRKVSTCPDFPFLNGTTCNDGQFVSSTVNWLAVRELSNGNGSHTHTRNELVIFSFDLSKEEYRYLLLPEGLSQVPSAEPNLAVLRGCLCISLHDQNMNLNKPHFVVWQMSEFGDEKSWTRLVNLSYGHFRFEPFPYPPSPMFIFENGDTLLLKHEGDSEVILYNEKNCTIRRAKTLYNAWFDSRCYAQSLVLPW